MTEWFEVESFWREVYPFMFPDDRFEAAAEEIDRILALLDFQGSSVLDLCCGPGRHSVELAKRGCIVTGVDRTPFLLNKARERALNEGVDIEWVEEDMRRFVRPDAYDLVLSMFTSFGYFESGEEDIVVLGNMLRSLKPGGAVVLEMMGKEPLARMFQPTISQIASDGALLIHRQKILDGWSRLSGEWIVVRGRDAQSFNVNSTIYSGRELCDLLESVGFREVRTYGNLHGDDYDLDAKRLIAVGRKPTG